MSEYFVLKTKPDKNENIKNGCTQFNVEQDEHQEFYSAHQRAAMLRQHLKRRSVNVRIYIKLLYACG